MTRSLTDEATRHAGDGQPTAPAVLLCAGINGLGALRSLARAGVRASVVFADRKSPVRFSTLAAALHLVPREVSDVELLRVLEPYGAEGAAVIACSDAYAEFLSRNVAPLRALGLRLAIPPGSVTEALNDKASEIGLVRELGLPMPASLTSLPGSGTALLAALALPIIVKPRSHAFAHLIRGKNEILRTPAEADAFVEAHRAHLDAFVAQEVIAGPDEALWVCNGCFDAEGELVSAFTFQRIRTSPAHFGVTSFGVGRNNPEIKASCAALGRALGYVGPAMFEFKHDAAHGVYRYIETNPRLGMCNTLDTHSGVNNVLTAYRVACGHAVPPCPLAQTDGVHFLNLYGDLWARLEDGEPLRRIAASYWACRDAPMAWALFDRRDWGPFLRSLRVAVGNTLSAIGRRLVRKATGLAAAFSA